MEEDNFWSRETRVDTLDVYLSCTQQAVSTGDNPEFRDDHWNCRETRSISQDYQLYPLTVSIPGSVTNTSCMFADPARLAIVAVYNPAVAELAVILRVKLKGGEATEPAEGQGLLIM